MDKKLTFRSSVVAVAVAAAAFAGSASAAAVDVSDVVTEIGAQSTPIALVGVAVLAIYTGIKAFRWVRAALG